MQSESPANTNDEELLDRVIAAVTDAGNKLRERFPPPHVPTTIDQIRAAIAANDAISKRALSHALVAALPNAAITDDDTTGGLLPSGQWWVVDWVEGNINHVQGTPEWGVTVALVRDNVAVLAVVYLPIENRVYTSLRGRGSWLNGQRITVSCKVDLSATIVGTAQATPHDSTEANRKLGNCISALQNQVLLVRMMVPSTLQLVKVASGSADAFWQHANNRSGQIAGVLLVQEAGGTVTDTYGAPWTLASKDLLATCPGVHAALVTAFSDITATDPASDDEKMQIKDES